MATKPNPPALSRDRAGFLCDSAGRILSVHVRGEIDHHTAASIRQGIDGVLFEKRPKKLILDLSAVSFMDSSGLGLIMGRYSVMKELGGEMIVWDPSPETRSILTLAGMERMVRIEYPEGRCPADVHPPSSPVRQAPARRTAASRPTSGKTSPRKRKKPPTAALSAESDRKEQDA